MSNHLEGSTTRVDCTLDLLPAEDRAFLKACILGDGWLGLQRKKFVHLRIGHSAKQRDWLAFKAKEINRILGKDKKVLGPYWQSDGTSRDRKHESYLYCVDDHALFRPWFLRWYEVPAEGKVIKHVTHDFLSDLGLRELAVLWCDDGSVSSSNRTKSHKLKDGTLRKYPYVEAQGQIALCSLDVKEYKLIQDWLCSITGIKWRYTPRTKDKRATLSIGKKQLREFLPLITPYVPSCMSYKVDLSHCRIW
jgi:LAGLIDADG DNA endonuclease family